MRVLLTQQADLLTEWGESKEHYLNILNLKVPKINELLKEKWKLVVRSCLILSDPTDCNLLGSSVYRILQARILEWVAMPFSRGSS